MKYFNDLLKSIPALKKIVLLMFSIKNDIDFLREYGFINGDFNRLCLEFKKILIEQKEEYLEYIKNEEESILGRIFIK